MIDISEIISDPDFAQEFLVHREIGANIAGRYVVDEIDLTLYGVIIPATTKDLEQIPEGDRVTGMMVFYVPIDTPLYITKNDTLAGQATNTTMTSDQCVWRGDKYRIFQTNSYDDYGYIKAICVYMQGD
jgi:hypothetical protein